MSITRGPVWLFVPGDRPERFDRASDSGADQVICDLEDAVADPAKVQARSHVVAWLTRDRSAWVRVNAPGSRWHQDDLIALTGCPGLVGVIVPKVESDADLERALAYLAVPVAPLVESARGVENLRSILAVERVERLLLGAIDLAVDVDCAEESDVMTHVRSRMVLASRAAGKQAPVDGVTRALRDQPATLADAARARREGFSGKLAIHPAQVVPIRAVFTPSADDVTWAATVLASVEVSEHGALAAAGDLVDAPVIERARRILAAVQTPNSPDREGHQA